MARGGSLAGLRLQNKKQQFKQGLPRFVRLTRCRAASKATCPYYAAAAAASAAAEGTGVATPAKEFVPIRLDPKTAEMMDLGVFLDTLIGDNWVRARARAPIVCGTGRRLPEEPTSYRAPPRPAGDGVRAESCLVHHVRQPSCKSPPRKSLWEAEGTRPHCARST